MSNSLKSFLNFNPQPYVQHHLLREQCVNCCQQSPLLKTMSLKSYLRSQTLMWREEQRGPILGRLEDQVSHYSRRPFTLISSLLPGATVGEIEPKK